MEVRITTTGTLIFVVLLTIFYFLGGFTNPGLQAQGTVQDPATISKAWIYALLMFLVGAFAVCFIEHQIGLLAPVNLRFIYLLGGAGLMTGAVIWGNLLREAVAIHAGAN